MQVLGSIDIRKGSQFDLTQGSVQHALINFVLVSHVAYTSILELPAPFFSIARKGLKNLENPRTSLCDSKAD